MVTQVAVGRNWVLMECWTEGLSFLMTAGSKLPPEPASQSIEQKQHSIKNGSKRFVFIRSKSLVQPILKGLL